MASNPRLGRGSPVSLLPHELLRLIVLLWRQTDRHAGYLLLVGGMRAGASSFSSDSGTYAIQLSTGRAHAEPSLPVELSGHALVCCAAPPPAAAAGAGPDCPSEGIPGLASSVNIPDRQLRHIVAVGGFTSSCNSSSSRAQVLQLDSQSLSVGDGVSTPDEIGCWQSLPRMSACRHGGFASALLSSKHDGGPKVLAAAGGRPGPRMPPRGDGEWLCAERAAWYPLGGRMLTGRYGCAGASLRGQLLAIGGSDGTHNLASVEAIDHRDGKWRALAPLPLPLYGCSAVELLPTHFSSGAGIGQGGILVCGGCDALRQVTAAAFVYDSVADRWRSSGGRLAASRGTHIPTRGHLVQPRMCHALVSVPSRYLPTATVQQLPTQPPPEDVVLALGGQSSSLMHRSSLLSSVEVCCGGTSGPGVPQGMLQAAEVAPSAVAPEELDFAWQPLLEWGLPHPTWHHGACAVLI